jgi:hypothetical protein
MRNVSGEIVERPVQVRARRTHALKAVEKKRAYEDIVKQVRDLIEKGKLKKGDRLRSGTCEPEGTIPAVRRDN